MEGAPAEGPARCTFSGMMISAEQHNENTGSVTVHYPLPTVPCGASWRDEEVVYPLSRGFHVKTRVLSKDQRKAQQRHYYDKLQYVYQQRNPDSYS